MVIIRLFWNFIVPFKRNRICIWFVIIATKVTYNKDSLNWVFSKKTWQNSTLLRSSWPLNIYTPIKCSSETLNQKTSCCRTATWCSSTSAFQKRAYHLNIAVRVSVAVRLIWVRNWSAKKVLRISRIFLQSAPCCTSFWPVLRLFMTLMKNKCSRKLSVSLYNSRKEFPRLLFPSFHRCWKRTPKNVRLGTSSKRIHSSRKSTGTNCKNDSMKLLILNCSRSWNTARLGRISDRKSVV